MVIDIINIIIFIIIIIIIIIIININIFYTHDNSMDKLYLPITKYAVWVLLCSCPVYCIICDIAPVNGVLSYIKINSNNSRPVLKYNIIWVTIHTEPPDVFSIG